jgi:hypothetical protein
MACCRDSRAAQIAVPEQLFPRPPSRHRPRPLLPRPIGIADRPLHQEWRTEQMHRQMQTTDDCFDGQVEHAFPRREHPLDARVTAANCVRGPPTWSACTWEITTASRSCRCTCNASALCTSAGRASPRALSAVSKSSLQIWAQFNEPLVFDARLMPAISGCQSSQHGN